MPDGLIASGVAISVCIRRPFIEDGAHSFTVESQPESVLLRKLGNLRFSIPIEKEKYQHDAQLDEKQQDQSAQFFFVDLEQMHRHGCAHFPKEERHAEIEQGEDEADNKCVEEKVP